MKNNNSIRFVILFGIIVGAVFTYIDEFWQIYLNEINIPVFLFGAVSSIRMFSSSVSGLYSHRLKRRFSYSTILSFVLVFICLSILFTSFIQNAWGLIPLVLTFAVFGLVEPIVLGYLHHRTDSSIRATVESFQSLALRICTILCGLIFGYFSTHYSIFTGFKVLGIILLVYLIYYFCSVRKNLSSY